MKTWKTLLPSNIEAEQVVLAGIMLDNTKLFDIRTILFAEDFYDQRHGRAYSRILELSDSGSSIEPVTLGELLDKDDLFTPIDVNDFLLGISNSTASGGGAIEAARIVHEKGRKRRYIETLERHAFEARKDMETTDDLIAKTEAEMFRISESAARGEPLTALEAMTLAEKRFDRRLAGEVIGNTTGYIDLDAKIEGFLPGQFIVVAGRPGSGKSSFAVNVAKNMVFDQGTPVLFFSLEMDYEDLMDRMASDVARLDGKEIMRPMVMSDGQVLRYRDASSAIKTKRFNIDAESEKMTQIISVARRHRYRHHVEVIFIDYIQLIDAVSSGRENRQEQVAKTSRRLKKLARELKVPIVALAQINRESDKQDRRPRISDLRESGALEQDADMVLLFHRPELNKPDEHKGEAECIVAKNRNGPTGLVHMTYLAHFTRFESAPKQDQRNGFHNPKPY